MQRFIKKRSVNFELSSLRSSNSAQLEASYFGFDRIYFPIIFLLGKKLLKWQFHLICHVRFDLKSGFFDIKSRTILAIVYVHPLLFDFYKQRKQKTKHLQFPINTQVCTLS